MKVPFTNPTPVPWMQYGLPDPNSNIRWVASRKRAVVKALQEKWVSVEYITKLYEISEEELDGWISAYEEGGTDALKTTKLQENTRAVPH
jgi:hypothetical protein